MLDPALEHRHNCYRALVHTFTLEPLHTRSHEHFHT
jgi:hypothetical protein